MDFEVREVEPVTGASVHGEVAPDALPAFFGRAFSEVIAAVQRAGASVTGPPFGLYPVMPTETTVVVEAGFPTSQRLEPTGDVHPIDLPGGLAVVTTHVGPYDTMARTYAAMTEWMTEQGLEPGGPVWESYLSDPSSQPDPQTWLTRIVWLVRRRA